jgi:hypothetical protein
MIHPSTNLRFINIAIGSGVFATERIPRGTITWTKCALDRVFTPAEARALGPAYAPILDKYAYVNAAGDYVLCWDLGRFMNHSCAPAVLSPGFDVDVAVRDILPGEELTCDYAMLNLEGEMPCSCGVAACRKVLGPADAARLVEGWDVLTRAAFTDVLRVSQPLWPFLREKDDIAAAARGERAVPSCGVHLRQRPRATG